MHENPLAALPCCNHGRWPLLGHRGRGDRARGEAARIRRRQASWTASFAVNARLFGIGGDVGGNACFQAGGDAVYISGEEAAGQVRLRAERLGLSNAPIQLAAATSVRDILTTLGQMEAPALLIIALSLPAVLWLTSRVSAARPGS